MRKWLRRGKVFKRKQPTSWEEWEDSVKWRYRLVRLLTWAMSRVKSGSRIWHWLNDKHTDLTWGR